MLLAAKRAYDLVRAGRRVYAEWAALPDDQKQAARAEAEVVRRHTAELGRRLGNSAAERIDRGREREGRDVGEIAADLSQAIARLKRLVPEAGLKPSRSMRFAGRAVARIAPTPAAREPSGGGVDRTPPGAPPQDPPTASPMPPDVPGAKPPLDGSQTDTEPPPEFLGKERKYASTTRSELGSDGLFWDVVPETVEWRVIHGDGGRIQVTKAREEHVEFAWADGRTEGFGAGPLIYVFTKYDRFCPTGCVEATRDFNVGREELSVRDLYLRCEVPPRWVGLLRRDEHRDEGEEGRDNWSFSSYLVVAPPGPRMDRPWPARTLNRIGGSLEGTGWIKPPPGVDVTPPSPAPEPRWKRSLRGLRDR
jgi:hypothetical protein